MEASTNILVKPTTNLMRRFSKTGIILTLDILLLFALLQFLPVDDPEVKKGLSLFTFIAVLWITEALPLAISAILVPILASLLGILPLSGALESFANPVIYLFLGGFALAAALHKHKIDAALASFIISLGGNKFFYSSLLLFVFTAFLSMWISNTTATAIMLPLAFGLLTQAGDKKDKKLTLFILLGTAYSATIGGISTLIGSPPNAIAASLLHLKFMDWFKVGLPTSLTLLPLLFIVLLTVLRPKVNFKLKSTNKKERPSLSFNKAQIKTITIFLLAIFGWLFSRPISNFLGVSQDFDTIVSLSVVVLLVMSGALTWKDVEQNTAWGIFILFGAGITLSVVLQVTGTSTFIVDVLTLHLSAASHLLIIFVSLLFVVFFTNLASNTAAGALLIPLLMILAESVGLSPAAMAIAVAVAANCAFMLPVGTPPNAIVFATGEVEQKYMLKLGFILNIVCTLTLTILVMTIYSIA